MLITKDVESVGSKSISKRKVCQKMYIHINEKNKDMVNDFLKYVSNQVQCKTIEDYEELLSFIQKGKDSINQSYYDSYEGFKRCIQNNINLLEGTTIEIRLQTKIDPAVRIESYDEVYNYSEIVYYVKFGKNGNTYLLTHECATSLISSRSDNEEYIIRTRLKFGKLAERIKRTSLLQKENNHFDD